MHGHMKVKIRNYSETYHYRRSGLKFEPGTSQVRACTAMVGNFTISHGGRPTVSSYCVTEAVA